MGADTKTKKRSNRLRVATSPYLRQHADNPVDWYPWGGEALERAAKEDKPIFLSIGYSSCHWCHVMAADSFSREDVAALLNRDFIPIKVDREERPDLDGFYQEAVMALSRTGGWPLTVFLTPDRVPFYGATFLPREDQAGMYGLKTVLAAIAQSWKEDRAELLTSAQQVLSALAGRTENLAPAPQLTKRSLAHAFTFFARSFDPAYGGFGNAPKFPVAHHLYFLLRYHALSGNEDALHMVKETLSHIAAGGIHDHLAGGFHRYATDRAWRLPHFEKMLYDQALLSAACLETFQVTGEQSFARVARSTLDFVLAEMTDPAGGFYSAFDADSPVPGNPAEHAEGRFYLWRKEEISTALPVEESALFCYRYGVKEDGNLGPLEFEGLNILYEEHSLSQTARHFRMEEPRAAALLESAALRLNSVRRQRPPPQRDDKILTEMNSLMVSSLARAGAVLGEEKYTLAAEKAAAYLLGARREQQHLLHSPGVEGFLDDYAFFSNALLDLYEATFRLQYLAAALELAQRMVALFWDDKEYGFFFTPAGTADTPLRRKELYDQAVPAGNSVALLVLLRLENLVADGQWGAYADKLLENFSGLSAMAYNATQFLSAACFRLFRPVDITIAEGDDHRADEFRRAAFSRFAPGLSIVFRPGPEVERREAARYLPSILSQAPLKGATTAFVCRDRTCSRPLTDPSTLAEELMKATSSARLQT
jgi:uncharacterized protein YyaL (SSP411 family)